MVTISNLTICNKSATCYIEMEQRVLAWRNTLGKEYPDLPGVRKYHEFLVVKAHDGMVVLKVNENCFGRSWKDSPICCYMNTDGDLQGHIVTMYDLLIASQTICHLRVLPFTRSLLLAQVQPNSHQQFPSRWYWAQESHQVGSKSCHQSQLPSAKEITIFLINTHLCIPVFIFLLLHCMTT